MSKLFWDAQVPWLRLNGSGARQFLQGQTSADLNALQSGDLLQTCWLTATGRLRAVLELRFDAEGADVIVLAGEASAVHAGFDQVIFPADRVRLRAGAPHELLIGQVPKGVHQILVLNVKGVFDKFVQSHPVFSI